MNLDSYLTLKLVEGNCVGEPITGGLNSEYTDQDSPGSPGVKTCLPVQGVRVRSLVGGLRSHMLCGGKNQNIKQKQYCNKFSKDLKKKRKEYTDHDLLNEEAQATHGGWQVAPSASRLPLWGNETPGSFSLKAQFQYTHIKEVKLQDLLLTNPRNRAEGTQ